MEKLLFLQVMGECHMTFLGVLVKGLKGREMSRVQELSSLKYENSTWDCLSYLQMTDSLESTMELC